MWRLCLAVTLAALSTGVVLASQSPPTPTPELSKATRKALDDHFDRWKMAVFDAALAQCRPTDGGSATTVAADLNGDGNQDLALAIQTPKGVHLVAVLTRLKDSLVIDVDTLGETAASGYLGLARRGASFKSPADKIDDFFAVDTLTVSRCNERVAYLWTGLGFRKLVVQ